MNRKPLEEMSIDRLWSLHEQITDILTEKINAEKSALNQRLQRLSRGVADQNFNPAGERRPAVVKRRPYPRVLPKYQNPADPRETWSGRGKIPRWLREKIGSGKNLDDFKIRSN